ncbi:Flavonol synthase [Bertholletia excelsa]
MEVQRVQAIASLSKCKDTIPAEYIRSEGEQPAITTVQGSQAGRVGGEAGRAWGIFQVVNHGIPDEVIADLQRVGKEFFELPQEEKEVYAKDPNSQSVEGYGSKLQKEVEGKKGWVDHLFHKIWPPSAINYKIWPKTPPSYREANEIYAEKLRTVADKLFKWLSQGIGLEGHVFKEAVGGDDLIYLMKINYYPPCPRPDVALGVVAHTDMSTLTILVPNEVPGLQVFKDDHWYDVKYIPNALIIHVGDQIEILSNGKYKAVLHRSIVNKDTTRMSWPVFLEPPPEQEVGPLPQLVDSENPAKYKTKKYKDYAYCKFNKIPQ